MCSNSISMKHLIALLFLFQCTVYHTFAQSDDKVVLITLDGLRWQELFGGASDSMMLNTELTPDQEVYTKYSAKSREEARKKLMPWFWSTVASQGQLRGNRWKDSKVDCTNRFWFSYPGYNEILTGFSDPAIKSNAKKNNTNVTVLEWLKNQALFEGEIAAFCSWDVFPYIINEERSEIHVNAGFDVATSDTLSDKEEFLNTLLSEIPSHWSTVRMDAFTHHYALEYMKKRHPKMVYISYGETDDFAHDGRYDHYLNSANQTDRWIQGLWEFIQSDEFYKGKTTMVITTDHGRGHSPMETWKSHGTIYEGSNQIWIAAIGPKIMALGEVNENEQLYQSQIARTVAKIFGFDYQGGKYEAGVVIDSFIK